MTARGRRTKWLIVIGIVLVGAAIFYVQFFLSRPIGSGPAGPPVDRTAFDEVWTERPVHLLGLGDSVTAGLGADSPGHSYFNRILANPKNEYDDVQGAALSEVLPNLTSENLAVSGSTSRQHLGTIEDRLQPQPANVYGVVVMTTGGNDLIHSYGRRPAKECAMYGATIEEATPWIKNFEVRLNMMLDQIEASFPGGCEIYLADIYDPTDGVGDAPSVYLPHWEDGLAIHAKYNDVIARTTASRENVHHVPMYEAFLGHGSHCRQFWRSTYVREDPCYWYYDNIEDPNDRGYDAIRRIFLNSIVEHTKVRGMATAVDTSVQTKDDDER